MYKYHAYGLNISSVIELNELIPKDFLGEADLTIQVGEVPLQLEGQEWGKSWWQVNDEFLLCDYTDVLRALVNRNGQSSLIQYFTKDLFQLRSFIYSRVLSAVLLIRGYYLLHGACAKIGDKAYAFCGPSGVGKSTLAYALHLQGCTVYSDDVVCLKIKGDKVNLYPGFPRIRLTEEVIEKYEGEFEEIEHFPGKKNFLGKNTFDLNTVELGGVFLIKPTSDSKVSLTNIEGWQKLKLLDKGRYRKAIEQKLYTKELILQRRVEVSNMVQCQYLQRPNDRFCVDDIVDFVFREIINK